MTVNMTNNSQSHHTKIKVRSVYVLLPVNGVTSKGNYYIIYCKILTVININLNKIKKYKVLYIMIDMLLCSMLKITITNRKGH